MRNLARLAIALFAMVMMTALARAQTDNDNFYEGKSITLIIPIGPGGAYDTYARLVARHLGKYIPGNPTIVARNMPGGGGIVATNHAYNVAPHDGTTLIIITSTFAIEQLLDTPQIKYDARNFQAIGRLTDTTSIVAAWHTSPIKTAAELLAKPSIAAVSSLNEIYAARFLVMNRLLGAKIKLVPGYPSGRDYILAAQRNEVDEFWNPYISLSQLYATDFKEKRFNILVQSGTTRDKEMPEVPTMIELSNDPDAKQIFRHLGSNDEIGRSILTTPGVPPERVKLLQAAFQKMLAEPALQEETSKLGLPLAPKSGDEVQKIIGGTFDASPELLRKVKELVKQ